MQLTRPARRPALISIVPMIDVLLILLVFFMVTSTYLNLDLIPTVESREDAPPAAAAPTDEAAGQTLLIRLASDGTPVVAGRTLTPATLTALLSARLAEAPLTNVIVLPSARASLQSLVTVMDTATAAGATRLRVIRLEGQP